MGKKIALLLICILLTTGSFDAAADPSRNLTEEEALITSFKSSGADISESTISCWTKLNNRFLTIKQIETEMNKIIGQINPDKRRVVKNVESDNQLNKIVLYGSKGNKTYSIAIESLKQENSGETYIVFDLSIDKSYGGLMTERQNIAKILQVDESSINFSSCITGTYKGKLTGKEIGKKSGIVLQSINAKRVEGIEDEEMESISAFSNRIGGYVMSDQNPVNVQLAIRYSAYDNKTYIWIGTPLISTGY